MNCKYNNFMNALRELCITHDVGLNLNEYDCVEVYDLGADCNVFCNIVFEDCTL